MRTVNDKTNESILRDAKTTIYRLNEHDENEYEKLPVNPSSLRFSDTKLELEYRKALYCEKTNFRELNSDFKSGLINFYIGVFSLVFFEVGSFGYLRYEEKISIYRFILVLVMVISIIAASLIMLCGIYWKKNILINNRKGYSFIGTLLIFYLVLTDERVLSGIFEESFNENGIQHSNFALGVFVMMKFILLDGFVYILIVVMSYIVFVICFFCAFSTVEMFSVWNEIMFVTVIGVILVADSYASEIRTKQLFLRIFKEEEKVNFSSYNPISRTISEVSSIENTIDICQSIKEKLKEAYKVIIFKDTKEELKQSTQEIDSLMKRISQSTMLYRSPAKRLYQMDEEEAKFLEEFMNLNIFNRTAYESEFPKQEKTFEPIPLQTSITGTENIISEFGKNWNFDIWVLHENFEEIVSLTANQFFEIWELKPKLNINNETFHGFFNAIQEGYLQNPFHNACHATDVFHSLVYFLEKSSIMIKLDSFDLLALSLAALGHNIGHLGLTNRFLITENSELAEFYNDSSILENMSSSKIFELTKFHNLFKNFEKGKYTKIRRTVIEMILETDLSHHFELVGRFNTRAFTLNDFELENEDDKILILGMGLKAADLGYTAKKEELHLKWSRLMAEEFEAEGEYEKQNGVSINFFFDRESLIFNENQGGFFKNVCLPLFEVWCFFLNVDEIYELCLNEVKRNLEMWQENFERVEKLSVSKGLVPLIEKTEVKRFGLLESENKEKLVELNSSLNESGLN